MIHPAPNSPRVTVAYGDSRRSTVEFALDARGSLIGRYLSHASTWERRAADPQDPEQSGVIASLVTLLNAYGKVTTC